MKTSEEQYAIVRLLEASRGVVAAWEQHNSLMAPASPEEFASRHAVATLIRILEERAESLKAEIERHTCPHCGEEVCEHGWCNCDCYNEPPCPQCRDRHEAEQDAEREANWQRNVIGPMFGWDK